MDSLKETDDHKELLLSFEDIVRLAERPTYRSLEVGFRHHPLNRNEIHQRMVETLEEIAIIARAALGWKQLF